MFACFEPRGSVAGQGSAHLSKIFFCPWYWEVAFTGHCFPESLNRKIVQISVIK